MLFILLFLLDLLQLFCNLLLRFLYYLVKPMMLILL